MEVKYLDVDDLETKEHELWWQKQGLSYTATGYGSKIPTTRMIRHNNRWHRVYCMIYSNIGSCYIVSKGETLFLRGVLTCHSS